MKWFFAVFFDKIFLVLSRIVFSAILFSVSCFSDIYAQETEEEDEAASKVILQEDPWPSTRAAGMAGALAAGAEGMDAAYYNPAGIGGLFLNKKQARKSVRYFGFPYIAGGVNETSTQALEDMQATGPGSEVTTQAVLDAHAGHRQYARAALVPGVIVSRFLIAVLSDIQVAAVSRGEGSNLIRVHQQSSSGPAFGMSVTDPKGQLYLGAFGASLSQKVIDDDLTFGEMVDYEHRKEALSQKQKDYSGSVTHAGLLWRISPKGNPTVGVAVRHLGDSKFQSSDGPDRIIEENIALAFGVAPRLGRWGFFSFFLEADRLLDPETAVSKKLKAATEFSLGTGYGTDAVMGLRAGYNSAGGSAGFHVNIGLIGLQVATYAQDLGNDNEKVIERRYVGTFSINVAY